MFHFGQSIQVGRSRHMRLFPNAFLTQSDGARLGSSQTLNPNRWFLGPMSFNTIGCNCLWLVPSTSDHILHPVVLLGNIHICLLTHTGCSIPRATATYLVLSPRVIILVFLCFKILVNVNFSLFYFCNPKKTNFKFHGNLRTNSTYKYRCIFVYSLTNLR